MPPKIVEITTNDDFYIFFSSNIAAQNISDQLHVYADTILKYRKFQEVKSLFSMYRRIYKVSVYICLVFYIPEKVESYCVSFRLSNKRIALNAVNFVFLQRYENDGDLSLKNKNGAEIAMEMRTDLQLVLSAKIDSVKVCYISII
mgnify:CR=1 FL=1